MRILVTRPARDAERTAARLAALGHEILCAPLIEIVATGASLPIGPQEAVLATSAQAIAFLKDNAAQAILHMPFFGVGDRTAAAARAAGFLDVRPATLDAARLSQTIHAAYARPASFVYLAGRDRKSDLETTLVASGHTIEVVIVYEARAAATLPRHAVEALGAGGIDAVLHYSNRSATIFRQLVEAANLAEVEFEVKHVCISADAAAPLQGWAARIAVAPEPNEAAMVEALGKEGDR
jgi:uroporphyrinogen-III synthase